MLVMMRFRFGLGAASRKAYERFARWTPSDGFEIKAGWTSANNDGGFLVLDVANTERLLEFSAQFRDLNDGATACYQAIVSVPIRATNIRAGGVLPGTYMVELPEIASHPVASDLGLEPTALSSVKGFWLDFDFVLGRGTEVWRAQ